VGNLDATLMHYLIIS